jgi:predicted nucleotidyltransferase
MRLSDKTIIHILKRNIDVLIKYHVKKIGLFGSYVRGDQRSFSDIDLLVEFDMSTFDENFSGYFDNFLSLRSTLQDLLKAKVDLVTNEMISHYIKPFMEHEIRYVKTA